MELLQDPRVIQSIEKQKELFAIFRQPVSEVVKAQAREVSEILEPYGHSYHDVVKLILECGDEPEKLERAVSAIIEESKPRDDWVSTSRTRKKPPQNRRRPQRPRRTPKPSSDRKDEKAVEAESRPVESKPVEQRPVEAKPVEARPAETRPVEARPTETRPVEARLAETRPVEARPTEVRPVETRPVEARPVETKPPDSRPVEARHVETRPTETRPVEVRPVETRQLDSRQVEVRAAEVRPAEVRSTEVRSTEIRSNEVRKAAETKHRMMETTRQDSDLMVRVMTSSDRTLKRSTENKRSSIGHAKQYTYGGVPQYGTAVTGTHTGGTHTGGTHTGGTHTGGTHTGGTHTGGNQTTYGGSNTSTYGANQTSQFGGVQSTSNYGINPTSHYTNNQTSSQYGGNQTSSQFAPTTQYGSSTSHYGGNQPTSQYGSHQNTAPYGNTQNTSQYGTTASQYGSNQSTSQYGNNSFQYGGGHAFTQRARVSKPHDIGTPPPPTETSRPTTASQSSWARPAASPVPLVEPRQPDREAPPPRPSLRSELPPVGAVSIPPSATAFHQRLATTPSVIMPDHCDLGNSFQFGSLRWPGRKQAPVKYVSQTFGANPKRPPGYARNPMGPFGPRVPPAYMPAANYEEDFKRTTKSTDVYSFCPPGLSAPYAY